VCSPKAGAGRVGSPGGATHLHRHAELAHGAEARLLDCADHAAARTSSGVERFATPSTGSMQQSCSSLKAFHSSRLRARKTSALPARRRTRRLELRLDQVGALDAVAEGGPELRLQHRR
jgi:hypothetical protein